MLTITEIEALLNCMLFGEPFELLLCLLSSADSYVTFSSNYACSFWAVSIVEFEGVTWQWV